MLFPKKKSSKNALKKRLPRRLSLQSLEHRRVMAAAILNEVSVNPNGADQPYEFVEIKGIPNAPADDIYFVAFESDGNAGLADLVFSLDGLNFGSNGLLVITTDSGFGHPIPFETTVLPTFSFAPGTSQSLENNSTSFVLISSPTPIIQGDDYETDGDGILELPAGARILDSFGFTDAGAADVSYGPIVAISDPPPTTAPGAATRFRSDNRPSVADAWFAGNLLAPNSNTIYNPNPATSTPNMPVGAELTPGAPNSPGTNSAPVGNADVYDVEPGGTLTVLPGAGVLSNDTDADGPMSILYGLLLTSPTNGTLSFDSDGSFVYVNDGTPGTDSFTYLASDLEANTTPITVTLNAQINTNTPPTLTLGGTGVLSHVENVPTVLAPSATVADTDSVDFSTGSLTVAIFDAAQPDDELGVLDQGTGVGQIGVAGSFVSYEGNQIGIINGGLGSEPLVINLNSNATLAAVQTLTRSITFNTPSDDPDTSLRSISFLVNDGDGGQSLTQTLQIGVTPVNDAPVASVGVETVNYATGDPAITVAGLFTASDADSPTFDGGVLTATISGGLQSGDVLDLRSVGTGADQVSVSGTTISVGGVAVATASGLGTSSLTITLNSAATVASANAIARSVTYQTSQTNANLPARIVSFSLTDGQSVVVDAGTVTVTQSLVKKYAFQQNVDAGLGLYTSAADSELRQAFPDDAFDSGFNPTEGLLVDWDAGTVNSQVQLRFGDLFGPGQGQIPLGSQIVSARLVVETTNPGDGGTFHRLLNPLDQTATWNSTVDGIQADDVESRAQFESQIGVATGSSDTQVGKTAIGVTRDIQAWANGETNNGWVIRGFDLRGDGWAFQSSENVDPTQRPRLEVEWLPGSVASTSFQNGVDNYVGTFDTSLSEAAPDADNSAAATVFVDDTSFESFNTSQGILRFADIIGGTASQIPAGSVIQAAVLDLASVTGNSKGDGGTFHRLLQDLPFEATWFGFDNGVQADGVEAEINANVAAGDRANGVKAEAGLNTFDVTADVQAWVDGTATNFGWAMIPYAGGTDGWGFSTSDQEIVEVRPRLRVFFTAPAIVVAPTSGLVTSEGGQSDGFSIVLATPPTADVTIPLSSSDTTEGILSVSSITFTPANWDTPQIVTVTGVSDTDADGDVTYSIVSGASTSSDPAYNGLDAADVSVINQDASSVAAPQVESVVFGDGTAQRSMIREITVQFDSKITASANAFVLQRRVDGVFVTIPSSELAISYTDIGDASRTIARLTFSGTSVRGGSLSDGNYRLTLLATDISNAGGQLDGNGDGTGGDDFVRGAVEADAFFRLFGDTNGNRITTGAEFGQIRLSLNRTAPDPAYNELFDLDGNGLVSGAEFGQLRLRLNRRLGF